MDKAWRLALAGLILSALAGRAAAAEDHLWAKVGATEAAVTSDFEACQKEAKERRYHLPDRTMAVSMLGGGAALYLLAAGEMALDHKQAQITFARHCMTRHGYVWLPMTRAESGELARIPAAQDRRAWIDNFYANVASSRLDSAWAPVVPPLPTGLEEPLVFDGLRFDPITLTPAPGVVKKGGVVLSGPVVHAATARLTAAVVAPVIPELRADAGTVFYQVVMPTDYDPDQTYWCGPMTYFSASGPRTQTYCVDVGDKGYEISMAGLDSDSWYAPPPPPGAPLMREKAAIFAFAPSEQDLLGSADLTLTVKAIDKEGVTLQASVSSGKHHAMIWNFRLPFVADGAAVLPFWTYRLVLTHQDKGVAVAFTPDGDGSGWLDAAFAA